MLIDLAFPDRRVMIDLFDTPGVRRWFEYCQSMTQGTGKIQRYYTQSRSTLNPIPTDIDQQWHRILHSWDRLRDLGYQMPWKLPDHWPGDQATLNRLHRFFTFNAMWADSGHQGPNPFDAHWPWPASLQYREFFGIIDDINLAVHVLETHSDSQHRAWARDHYQLTLMDVYPIKSDHDQQGYLWFTPEEQRDNYTYWQHQGPLVTLNGSILGKSVFNSWLDHDDPQQPDCTGRLGSYGGFVIELDDHRRQIYQSRCFSQWAREHDLDVTQAPLEFVIGSVRDHRHTLPWLSSNHGLMQGIRFRD